MAKTKHNFNNVVLKVALRSLESLIEQDWEYPDAHSKVCLDYGFTVEQGEQLTALYDEQ